MYTSVHYKTSQSPIFSGGCNQVYNYFCGRGRHKTLSEIIAGLRDNGYVQSDGAEGALGRMILAFTKNKMLVENYDLEYLEYIGFFFDDVNKKIIASNLEIKNEIQTRDLKNALNVIEEMAAKYYAKPDRLDLLATSIVWLFETLVANHRGVNSELYHINISGEANKVNYKAIGIGKLIADAFCKKWLENSHTFPTMNDFIKRAYTTIIYMERFCVGMGVGIGNDIPNIKYLDYYQEWDKQPPAQDIEECKNYADEKLKKPKESFDEIIDTL